MTLSDAASLLHDLRERGVDLEIVGARLRYRPPEVVTPELRQRLVACKPAILAMLHEEAFVTAAGDGDKPSVERCRLCRELDFVRPRVGGAWRCARCCPYDLPGTEVAWWPRVTMTAPLASWMLDPRPFPPDAPDPRRVPRACCCCGGTSLWRLPPHGLWTCSRCHPPLPAPEAIETVTIGEDAP